jgi:hypothetical protein
VRWVTAIAGKFRQIRARKIRSEQSRGVIKEANPMFRTVSTTAVAAALALLSSAAFAQQGTSSSWGSVGWGPVIPTQSLTPRERQWNFDNESKYEAENSAEWLRVHGKGLFPFFQ